MRVVSLVAVLSLAACSGESKDKATAEPVAVLPSAATLGEQNVLSIRDYLAEERYRKANVRNGSRQVLICKACHSLDKGGPNMIGPGLFGFFGREVGQQPGFDYSPVLRNASFIWTPRAIDAWLAQPARFLPGNRMTFTGVQGQEDRDDLIACLLASTSDDSSQ